MWLHFLPTGFSVKVELKFNREKGSTFSNFKILFQYPQIDAPKLKNLIFCVYGARDQTQGLTHAKKV